MAALHGGARPGSGRKPKSDEAPPREPARFADPLAYLIAVATGEAPGDALQLAAAKAALPYTQPKARAPVASPAPRELRAKNDRQLSRAASDDWDSRASAVRRRFANKEAAK